MNRAHQHAHDPIPSVVTEGHVIHWAGRYDRVMSLFTLGNEAGFRRRTVEAAALRSGERVLDVGCGTGTLAIVAAERVGAGGQVTGVDPSVEMIAEARAKASQQSGSGVGAVRFEVAAVERLPFEPASFDVVLSTLVFHHLPASLQRQGLTEIQRVLVPGGRLLIVDFPGRGPLLHRLLGRFVHRHGDRETHQGHALDRVVELALELGFEDIEISRFRPRFLRKLSARTAVRARPA